MDNDNYKTHSNNSEAVVSEGHIDFHHKKNGFGFSSVLFFRESGHFWTDSSLLGIVNTGSVNNDGNAQGARLDIWHPFNGSFTYVFSDYSSGIGDDIHLLRLRQSFIDSKLHTGIFYQRKNYSSSGKNDFNEVVATDFRYSIGR